MKITVMSGKGGAGKTTLAANLARLWPEAVLADLDVEEPNCALYTRGLEIQSNVVSRSYPEIDEDKCTHCGKCAAFCRFHALLVGRKATVVMKELCHSCNGCSLVCPEGAITMKDRRVGEVKDLKWNDGTTDDRLLTTGLLDIGEMSAVFVINRVNQEGLASVAAPAGEQPSGGGLLIADGPPGTSCNAAAALLESDYVLLAAEATPFGLSDLSMVVDLLNERKISFSVVLNKTEGDLTEVDRWFADRNITVVGRIPFSREAAAISAQGGWMTDLPEIRDVFISLRNTLSCELNIPVKEASL